ncbi:MAG: hypothetical protein AAF763_16765, partial [Pseudomonadota bacterium]
GGCLSPVDGSRIDAQGALTVAEIGALELRGEEIELDRWLRQFHRPFETPDRWQEMPGGLTNDGLLRKTGGGEALLDGEIGGDGEIRVEDGALVIEGRVPFSALDGVEALHLRDGVLIMDEAGSIPRLTVEHGQVAGDFDLEATEALHLGERAVLAGPV